MNEILEHKGSYLILKEYNFIKLYSFKSLVSVYNTDTKEFSDVPYTFMNDDGDQCSYSNTTTRHINKFKKYITDNF